MAPCPPLETVVWHDLFLGRPRSRRYPKFNIRRDIPENNPPSFHLSGHYEVAKYYSLDEHTATPDVLLISHGLWEALSKEERAIVTEAARASATLQLELWRKATQEALDAVRAAGVTIVKPDKTPFVEAVEEVYASYPELRELE